MLDRVNTAIFLIVLVILCKYEQFSLEHRVGKIFDVMDFNAEGSLAHDEMVHYKMNYCEYSSTFLFRGNIYV